MTSQNWGSREPRVPPAVGALGALVNKAELLELLWDSWNVASDADAAADLVALVSLINRRRRKLDPMRGPLDASKLKGRGVLALRRACGAACARENQAAAAAEQEANP